MCRYGALIVLSILIFYSANGCNGSLQDVLSPEVNDTTFTDKAKTIRTTIPAGSITNTIFADEINTYIFEWQDKQIITSHIEIQFQSLSKARDHLAPDYESYFQKKCECVILKKGWILIANQKGREFQYAIQNKFGVDRIFRWKDWRIQIHGMAPTEYQELLKQRLSVIQQNLQLL